MSEGGILGKMLRGAGRSVARFYGHEPLDAAGKQLIRERFYQGVSADQVARELGVNRGQVLGAFNIMAHDDMFAVQRLARDGMSADQIAKSTGIPKKMVVRFINNGPGRLGGSTLWGAGGATGAGGLAALAGSPDDQASASPRPLLSAAEEARRPLTAEDPQAAEPRPLRTRRAQVADVWRNNALPNELPVLGPIARNVAAGMIERPMNVADVAVETLGGSSARTYGDARRQMGEEPNTWDVMGVGSWLGQSAGRELAGMPAADPGYRVPYVETNPDYLFPSAVDEQGRRGAGDRAMDAAFAPLEIAGGGVLAKDAAKAGAGLARRATPGFIRAAARRAVSPAPSAVADVTTSQAQRMADVMPWPRGDVRMQTAREFDTRGYHGTIQDFDTYYSRHPEFRGRVPIWASSDPAQAEGFVRSRWSDPNPEGLNVRPEDYRMQNPLEVDARGAGWDQIPFNVDANPRRPLATADAIAAHARRSGNDGVIIRNVVEEGGGPPADNFAVFDPENVRSAMDPRQRPMTAWETLRQQQNLDRARLEAIRNGSPAQPGEIEAIAQRAANAHTSNMRRAPPAGELRSAQPRGSAVQEAAAMTPEETGYLRESVPLRRAARAAQRAAPIAAGVGGGAGALTVATMMGANALIRPRETARGPAPPPMPPITLADAGPGYSPPRRPPAQIDVSNRPPPPLPQTPLRPSPLDRPMADLPPSSDAIMAQLAQEARDRNALAAPETPRPRAGYPMTFEPMVGPDAAPGGAPGPSSRDPLMAAQTAPADVSTIQDILSAKFGIATGGPGFGPRVRTGLQDVLGYAPSGAPTQAELQDIARALISTPREQTKPQDVIYDMQSALIGLGYDLGGGRGDGKLGPKTEAAVNAYLERVGAPERVRAGENDIAKLRDIWNRYFISPGTAARPPSAGTGR